MKPTPKLSRAAARTVLAWVDEILVEFKGYNDENIRRRLTLAVLCGRLETYAGENSGGERGMPSVLERKDVG